MVVFIAGGSNDTISGSIKSRMAASRHLGKLQRHSAVSLRQHGLLVVIVCTLTTVFLPRDVRM